MKTDTVEQRVKDVGHDQESASEEATPASEGATALKVRTKSGEAIELRVQPASGFRALQYND